jgi:hypothetical protein
VLARGKGTGRARHSVRRVRGPSRPGKRVELERLSGQRFYPVIEFEDGSVYREESKQMAATIRAGRLDEKRCTPT